MQIVIEISDDLYTRLHPKKTVLLRGDAIERLALEMTNAIRNGKTLSKGHGRLIDADAIVKAFKEGKAFYVNSWGGFEHMPMTDKARCDEIDNCISEVINAHTIIEADKEGQNNDNNT